MHPAIGLVVIDTLQRIRAAGNKTNPYYQDIGVLKDLADRHYIAVLLIHHLRKLNDDDPMDMISGITGLSGATGSNFVLRKRRRGENAATLYCTGRTSSTGSYSWSSMVKVTSGICSGTTERKRNRPIVGLSFFSPPCYGNNRRSVSLPRRCWKRLILPTSKG